MLNCIQLDEIAACGTVETHGPTDATAANGMHGTQFETAVVTPDVLLNTLLKRIEQKIRGEWSWREGLKLPEKRFVLMRGTRHRL